jgi:hypothetical protein
MGEYCLASLHIMDVLLYGLLRGPYSLVSLGRSPTGPLQDVPRGALYDIYNGSNVIPHTERDEGSTDRETRN